MPRYIDAEILKKEDFQDFSNTNVMYAIDHCPTADVQEVKHGRWIDAEGILVCSECGHATEDMVYELVEEGGRTILQRRFPYYCGKCGAYMGGENNGK